MADLPSHPEQAEAATGLRGARDAVLLVANYDSDVGYAWWLMESFWVAIAERWSSTHRVLLAYPSISRLPTAIAAAPLEPVQFAFSREASSLLQQVQFLHRHRVRLLYLTDRSSFAWRYLAYRLAGVRTIIVHDHTPGTRREAAGLRRLLKGMLHRLPSVTADALIAVTPFVNARHRNVNVFPPARCHVAENGLPSRPPAEPVNVRATFDIPTERRVLVTVGRAHRVKGIELVLDALAQLVVEKERRDIHLLHVGDGPDLDQFRAHAETLGVQAFVTFAGRRSDVRGLLRGADLAIHASSAEVGYSLAVLEYMEAGLPVIVSDDPSVCGATEPGRTGVHFCTGDARSAADAIASLLDHPALTRAYGANAASHVHGRYSLKRTHAQLLEAVDRAVQGIASESYSQPPSA